MIIGIVLIVIGAVMFMQFRKAQNAQKRTPSILWMIGAAIFSVFGLLNLLAAIFA